MCGIAGIWGHVDEDAVRTMMRRMVHRGPDSGGVFLAPESRGVLGHRRLAIIDPAGGRQPIVGGTDRSALVANGEIYNHRVLHRQFLETCDLQSHSDSEIILRLYEKTQEASVERLDGMFAYVIAHGDHVFAARDPIGIKPLYLGKREGALCFASEQKALVGFAADVEEFPPGTVCHSARGYRQFYRVPEPDASRMLLDPREAAQRLRDTLESAVAKRLMSDVPLGAFLSGGLDSSVICAIPNCGCGRTKNAFTTESSRTHFPTTISFCGT
jgi:asparagine synthase (glutamine-hydrolysing)